MTAINRAPHPWTDRRLLGIDCPPSSHLGILAILPISPIITLTDQAWMVSTRGLTLQCSTASPRTRTSHAIGVPPTTQSAPTASKSPVYQHIWDTTMSTPKKRPLGFDPLPTSSRMHQACTPLSLHKSAALHKASKL